MFQCCRFSEYGMNHLLTVSSTSLANLRYLGLAWNFRERFWFGQLDIYFKMIFPPVSMPTAVALEHIAMFQDIIPQSIPNGSPIHLVREAEVCSAREPLCSEGRPEWRLGAGRDGPSESRDSEKAKCVERNSQQGRRLPSPVSPGVLLSSASSHAPYH